MNTCYWDGEPFKTQPVYIPLEHSSKNRIISSSFCFCSYECAFAFLMDTRMFSDYQRDNSRQLLSEAYMKEASNDLSSPVYGIPRFRLMKYGGDLDIESFRKENTYSSIIDHRIVNISISSDKTISSEIYTIDNIYDTSALDLDSDIIELD